MSDSKQLELVELENGQVVIRESGEKNYNLVTLDFAAEVLDFLGDHKMEVCREMFVAGVQVASDIKQKRYDFWMSKRPLDLSQVDSETLLEFFSQDHPEEINQYRRLH